MNILPFPDWYYFRLIPRNITRIPIVFLLLSKIKFSSYVQFYSYDWRFCFVCVFVEKIGKRYIIELSIEPMLICNKISWVCHVTFLVTLSLNFLLYGGNWLDQWLTYWVICISELSLSRLLFLSISKTKWNKRWNNLHSC